MSYQALYRKFRPDNFDEIKGQDHIVTALRNQVIAERVGHAYLFCGTRGTGKTSAAKILSRAVNCENPVNGNPCNECRICRAIKAGTSMNVIEIDAASNNSVENVREIVEEVAYHPTEGKYKVYIIDEAHMLSNSAFNALLKTLEEPPSYVIFILATTEPNKIPTTILSRCQRYDFHRITVDTIADRIDSLLKQEGVEAEERAVRYIAKAGDGSMRDALSLLDQCIAFYLGQKLTYDNVLDVLGAADNEVFSALVRSIIAGDAGEAVGILDEMVTSGKELSQFVSDFTWYLRNLLIVKTSDSPEGAVDISSENMLLLKEESTMVDEETLMRYIRVLSELSGQIRFASQKRVLVEVAIIKLCRPQMETNLDSLYDRIRVLEQRLDEAPVQIISRESRPEDNENKNRPKKPEPVYAAPEDLKKIVADWGSIVGQTKGLLNTLLRGSVPSYDGATGEDILYIVYPDEGFLTKAREDKPEYIEEINAIIQKRTGKTAHIRLITGNGPGEETISPVSAEDIIKNQIHMDVESEDFDEE